MLALKLTPALTLTSRNVHVTINLHAKTNLGRLNMNFGKKCVGYC